MCVNLVSLFKAKYACPLFILQNKINNIINKSLYIYWTSVPMTLWIIINVKQLVHESQIKIKILISTGPQIFALTAANLWD